MPWSTWPMTVTTGRPWFRLFGIIRTIQFQSDLLLNAFLRLFNGDHTTKLLRYLDGQIHGYVLVDAYQFAKAHDRPEHVGHRHAYQCSQFPYRRVTLDHHTPCPYLRPGLLPAGTFCLS